MGLERLKSKVLILKANMQVFVRKKCLGTQVLSQGTCINAKKSFKNGRFFGNSEFNNAKSETIKVKL